MDELPKANLDAPKNDAEPSGFKLYSCNENEDLKQSILNIFVRIIVFLCIEANQESSEAFMKNEHGNTNLERSQDDDVDYIRNGLMSNCFINYLELNIFKIHFLLDL